jgi:hypothetical protein
VRLQKTAALAFGSASSTRRNQDLGHLQPKPLSSGFDEAAGFGRPSHHTRGLKAALT